MIKPQLLIRLFSKRLSTVLIFIITISQSSAQIHFFQEYKKLSRPEKWWTIFHPFIAKKSFRLTLKARAASAELMNDTLLDKDADGGQIDAFRHAYWMALLSQHICWRKALCLGKAHEKGNYLDFKKRKTEEGTLPDSAGGAMDLFNNNVGIAIGRTTKNISEEELKKTIRNVVLAGKMKVIRKNKTGEALDCEGNRVNAKKYFHVWNIPKCLVNSDYSKK